MTRLVHLAEWLLENTDTNFPSDSRAKGRVLRSLPVWPDALGLPRYTGHVGANIDVIATAGQVVVDVNTRGSRNYVVKAVLPRVLWPKN